MAATVFWAQACWVGRWAEDMFMVWKRQPVDATTWKQVRGPEQCIDNESSYTLSGQDETFVWSMV